MPQVLLPRTTFALGGRGQLYSGGNQIGVMSFSRQNGALGNGLTLLSVNSILGFEPPKEQQALGTKLRLLVSAVVPVFVQLGEAVVPLVTVVRTVIVTLFALLLNVATSPQQTPTTLNSTWFQRPACPSERTLSEFVFAA